MNACWHFHCISPPRTGPILDGIYLQIANGKKMTHLKRTLSFWKEFRLITFAIRSYEKKTQGINSRVEAGREMVVRSQQQP